MKKQKGNTEAGLKKKRCLYKKACIRISLMIGIQKVGCCFYMLLMIHNIEVQFFFCLIKVKMIAPDIAVKNVSSASLLCPHNKFFYKNETIQICK